MAAPIETPEGITIVKNGLTVNEIISVTEVEVLDLLSEGPIEGYNQFFY
jgi:hypothetical protein